MKVRPNTDVTIEYAEKVHHEMKKRHQDISDAQDKIANCLEDFRKR